jgi:hypothetical protein
MISFNKCFAKCVIGLTLAAGCVFAQPQAPLVPAHQIPDEIAYTALFLVAGPGAASHWDDETRNNWLTSRGFTALEASLIIGASARFRVEHISAERELARINEVSRGNLLSDSAKSERNDVRRRISSLIETLRADLRTGLGPGGAVKLEQLVDQIKRDIRMNAR